MTEKRFTYIMFDGFEDNGKSLDKLDVLDLLNDLDEENKKLKIKLELLQDDKFDNYEYVNNIEKENLLLKETIIGISALTGNIKDYLHDIDLMIGVNKK